MKTTFLASIHINRYPYGEDLRLIKRYGLTPEEQRELLNAAIVGYDPYHPDSPNPSEHKFSVPVAP